MGSIGTFGSFGIARLAISASSASLAVTGNNIANINTDGYCRQKIDLSAMYVSGTDQFASAGGMNFGTGVSTDNISQYRDPYMDIRYRDEYSLTSQLTVKLEGLADLAFVLDEVASGEADFGIIEAQFSAIVEQLQILSEKTGSEEYDTLVRSAAETLVQLFNSYSDKLDTVAENQVAAYVADIDETNALLTNIRDLNEQIRNAGIYGDSALTLRDQRNLLIDELSGKFDIDVIYSDEEIAYGLTVQNLTIKLAGTDTVLVDGLYCTQLSLPETINMPNTVDENGVPYFDTEDSSNYMYLDNDGNPTNDLKLAGVSINLKYPEEVYTQLLTTGTEGTDDYQEYEFYTTANPVFAKIVDGKVVVAGADDNTADGTWTEVTAEGGAYTGRWLDANGKPVASVNLAGPALNTAYWGYDSADPYAAAQAEDEDAWALDGTDVEDYPLWSGGQYAVGVWDETTNDWKLADDGSYLIVTTTNNPYLEEQDLYGEKYGLIQINNYVTEGGASENDNCYLLELSGLQDKKGNYITNDFNLPITGSILLTDMSYNGSLMANLELLTGEGEFSSKLDIAMNEDATIIRGIPYYQMSLDALAQQFASMFNDANVLMPQDIFACNSEGAFYDRNKMVVVDGIVQIGADGNPTYGLLTCYDKYGKEQELTIDNMYDQAYDEDGDPIDGMNNYEKYLYYNADDGSGGVRNENFLTDSDGNYLQSVIGDDGEVYYEPIQALDYTDPANPVPMEDSLGQPIYLTAANMTTQEWDRLTGTGYGSNDDGIGISKEVYDPDEMFKMDENGNFLNSLGQVITVGDNVPITLEMAYKDPAAFDILMDEGVLTEEYDHFQKQGALFSTSSSNNNTEGINASNISISRDWSIGETRILLSKAEDPGSSDNTNVLFMITMMDSDFQYDARDVASDAWTGKNEFFKGSFQEMLINTVSTLGQDMNTTTVLLTNSEVSTVALDNARISVSGVDLNEEATNLMQYQKSYTAAARLMTTLDEVLEVLLNM